MSITHAKVSAKSDGGDSSLVLPSDWNAGHVISGFNAAFIGAKAYNSTTQSLSDNTQAALTLDSEEFDSDGFHSVSSNTSRMTIPAGLGGKYLVMGGTYFVDFDADGVRLIKVRLNGNDTRGEARSVATSSGAPAVQVHTVLDLVAGDYVELWGLQNCGAAMNVGHASATPNQTWFSIVKLDSGKVGSGIGARVYNSADTTITTATDTALTFNTERWDTDGFHDTGSNTGRLTVPTGLGGDYLIGGHIDWEVNTAGIREIRVRLNGTTYLGLDTTDSDTTDGYRNSIATVYRLTAGDYVEMLVRQTSGGNLKVQALTNYSPEFWIARLDSGSSDPTFSDWTPVLTAVTTNPTLGSGSEAYGRYTQHGKLVVARGHIKFGTSGTNAGSGGYRISLPVTAASPSGSVGVYGHGYLYDDSTGVLKQHTLGFISTTTVQFVIDGTAGVSSPVDHAVPWAWGANDYLLFSMEYEAA